MVKMYQYCPNEFPSLEIHFLSGVEPIDKVATAKEHRLVYNVSKLFLSLIFKVAFFLV